MSGSVSPLQRGAILLLLLLLATSIQAQWHRYCYRDTFQVPAGVPSVLDVLANDDLNPSPSAPNYTANPVTVDYGYFFGNLQSEQGGTLVILNDDSIQYTPPVGYSGPDRFYYGIGSAPSSGAMDSAQVQLTVGTVTSVVRPLSEPVAIYPNPVQDVLRCRGIADHDPLVVFSLNGQQVAEGSGRVDVSRLSPGIYVVRVGQETEVTHLRFMKQ